MNRKAGIELRESQTGIVDIGPGNNWRFGVVRPPDSAVIAQVHPDFARKCSRGGSKERHCMLVLVRSARTLCSGNRGAPGRAAVTRTLDPGKRSGEERGAAAKENNVGIVGIDFNDVVVPALPLTDVRRVRPGPGGPSVGGFPDALVGTGIRRGVGYGSVNSACVKDAHVNPADVGGRQTA